MTGRTRNVNPSSKKLYALVFIGIIALSLLLGHFLSSANTYRHLYETIDARKTRSSELLAASSAASALVSAIPDDIGTPIAQELAQLSKYFLLATASLYLQKYLLTILGMLVFQYAIPLTALLNALKYLWPTNRKLKVAATVTGRLLTLLIVAYIAIPLSLAISSKIEETWSMSIEETMNAAITGETEAAIESAEDDIEIEQTTWWRNLINGASDLVTNITSGVKNSLLYAEKMLNRFIEAIAVMMVTTCVIPVATLLIVYHFGKMLVSKIMYTDLKVSID